MLDKKTIILLSKLALENGKSFLSLISLFLNKGRKLIDHQASSQKFSGHFHA